MMMSTLCGITVLNEITKSRQSLFLRCGKIVGDADENRYMDLMGFRKYIAIVKAGL